MVPHFVTAIYTNLEGTTLNGNGINIYPRYKESLLSLAAGGYPITLFTASTHYDELIHLYKDFPNVRVVVDELSSYPRHAAIEKIKAGNSDYNTLPSWRSRCVEIMWGKFRWVKMVMDEFPDITDVFWIDAGIFHGGLIPNKFRSGKSQGAFDFDLITQKRNLLSELTAYADGKVVNIVSTSVNHGSDDYLKVFPGIRPELGVIGGIFGGGRKVVEDYINTVEGLFDATIEAGVLLKEEELMYRAYDIDPDKYKTFVFNTWYHEDWGNIYVPGESISMSDFFEVIHA